MLRQTLVRVNVDDSMDIWKHTLNLIRWLSKIHLWGERAWFSVCVYID